MRYIPGGFEPVRGFEVSLHINQRLIMVYLFDGRKVSDIILRFSDHRHHPLEDIPVGLEEIDQGCRNNKNETTDKPARKEKDLGVFNQLLCLQKMSGFKKIKYQEEQRDNRIIDTEL